MAIDRPSLQALLVCEMVIEDITTRNKSIIGTFTHILAPGFPCIRPQMGVYFCITDAEGAYEFRLDLVHITTNQIVGRATISGVTINDRLAISDFGVMLSPVQFPAQGRYEFRLYANNAFIGNKDFNVIQQPNPAGDA